MTTKEKPALTRVDVTRLKAYLTELERLESTEPEWFTLETGEEISNYYDEHGEIPAEYRDRVATSEVVDEETGETFTAFYDIAYEEWSKELAELQARYRDTVLKALRYALDSGEATESTAQVGALLEKLIANVERTTRAAGGEAGDLFTQAYLPMLNGALSTDLMQLVTRGMKADTFTRTATFTTRDGHKISIENFDKLQAALGTPAKKLFDTAVSYLTDTNFYRAGRDHITPTVEIPLVEYGEACGYELTPRVMATDEEQKEENERARQRVKDFKKDVRANLRDLSSILWTGEETKGRNRGDYKEMRIVSSHSIRDGVIRINFDVDAAAYLINAYVMQLPTALLSIDNRNPNAYAIGRKLAFHNSNDQNRAKGTESTLSVEKLLLSAPNIPTYDEMLEGGQRNWKLRIKKPLEAALEANVEVGVISRWEYRARKTGETYTAETAQRLTWTQYSRLMVDFAMVDAPEQTERRAAIAEAKRQKAADKEKTRRKRGRPRKNEGGVSDT